MKHIVLYIGIAAGMVASCSIQGENFQVPIQDDVTYYATFEQPAEEGTRVYANENLLLRWTADDRVSIFGKNTYNQQYKFLGETGDNSGGFSKVDGAEYVTGNPISHTVSVYPYQASTKITEDEVLTVDLPAVQYYAKNTFGLGANTMVSVSSDNVLQYKNVGGYLMVRMYGEGVSVSSITLKGNNGEKLAGKATITMPENGVPSVEMASDAIEEINLTCSEPAALGATEEESTQFWFVVPPVTFENGFTITVKRASGASIEKSTIKSFVIERNKLAKMAAIEIEPQSVIYYTSSDSEVITPYQSDGFGAEIVSNEYIDGVGIITFNGRVSSIGDKAFRSCKSLTSIIIPDGVTTIGNSAFGGCSSLTSISMPNGLLGIGDWTFSGCKSLFDITIPESVTSIGNGAFNGCTMLFDITIPKGVTSIGEYAFFSCGIFSISLPESVISIADFAFLNCGNLQELSIPKNVTSIGKQAFYGMINVTNITVLPVIPPTCGENVFSETNNAPIYVPAQSINEYKTAEVWSSYADRIIAMAPVPEAVDLGLSIKWASFNLGATKPEEYGDYYAWGEAEPYYSSQDPLIWNEGKEAGYDWPSYKYCMGTEAYSMTKYCTDSHYGNGYSDTKIVLDPEDDAAHVNLGGNWRMPTDAEWTELRENCTWTWITQNGVNGRLVTAINGNSIFLPAAGCRDFTDLNLVGLFGDYWSSSLDTNSPFSAWDGSFGSGDVRRSSLIRSHGYSVRPVCE